jgi:hypothetical protein
VEKLRAELGNYDRLVAAMGGMLKDVSGEGDGSSVESPIFDYKNFERLEHEDQREFGGRILQLRKGGREKLDRASTSPSIAPAVV